MSIPNFLLFRLEGLRDQSFPLLFWEVKIRNSSPKTLKTSSYVPPLSGPTSSFALGISKSRICLAFSSLLGLSIADLLSGCTRGLLEPILPSFSSSLSLLCTILSRCDSLSFLLSSSSLAFFDWTSLIAPLKKDGILDFSTFSSFLAGLVDLLLGLLCLRGLYLLGDLECLLLGLGDRLLVLNIKKLVNMTLTFEVTDGVWKETLHGVCLKSSEGIQYILPWYSTPSYRYAPAQSGAACLYPYRTDFFPPVYVTCLPEGNASVGEANPFPAYSSIGCCSKIMMSFLIKYSV